MPWPPTLPPATRTNATPQQNTHPADHNMIANALADLVAYMPRVIGRYNLKPPATGPSAPLPAGYLMLVAGQTVTVATGRLYRFDGLVRSIRHTNAAPLVFASTVVIDGADLNLWNNSTLPAGGTNDLHRYTALWTPTVAGTFPIDWRAVYTLVAGTLTVETDPASFFTVTDLGPVPA